MVDAYAEAHNAEKMIELFRLMIEKATNRNTADGARLRLSQVLEGVGKLEEAIACLKKIDDEAGVAGAKQRIPELEQKVTEKKRKGKRK
jgi:pentatricopeptide repeat protein